MINTILTGLFKVIFAVLRFITNIILLPLTALINGLLPDFSNYTDMAYNFINRYLLNAIACGREIFLNLTGFPQVLITISVNITLAFISVIGTLKIIAFVKNTWREFKGG